MWLSAGLNMHILTFHCVPTGHDTGMLEMIDASTLRQDFLNYLSFDQISVQYCVYITSPASLFPGQLLAKISDEAERSRPKME
jgi:hypothetical protein